MENCLIWEVIITPPKSQASLSNTRTMKQISRKAKALLLKFNNYADEDLIELVQDQQETLDEESLEVIESLLQARGYEINYEEDNLNLPEEEEVEYEKLRVADRLSLMAAQVVKNKERLKQEELKEARQKYQELVEASKQSFLEILSNTRKEIIQDPGFPRQVKEESLAYFKLLCQVSEERRFVFPVPLATQKQSLLDTLNKVEASKENKNKATTNLLRGISMFILGFMMIGLMGMEFFLIPIVLLGLAMIIINLSILIAHWILDYFNE